MGEPDTNVSSREQQFSAQLEDFYKNEKIITKFCEKHKF